MNLHTDAPIAFVPSPNGAKAPATEADTAIGAPLPHESAQLHVSGEAT